MNRCPDCNKFVSLENGDPEIDLDVSIDGTTITVTCTGRHVRNCAECSSEMKSVDLDMQEEVELTELKGFSDLSESDQEAIVEAANDASKDLLVEVHEGGASSDESGGGRYKKNLITTTVDATVKVTLGPIELEHNLELSEEHAASEYDESC